ncbi:hypothetical protein scyTo_0015255 [Scyliorhinus torazame]|uniref:Uncharacterized protein n=1 Tax=Scyliorhinus torazame TaxID=75743 RepID=A0A401P6Q8_SCYTO|nr:hypothetical protein [Scyliorhinus torazame]
MLQTALWVDHQGHPMTSIQQCFPARIQADVEQQQASFLPPILQTIHLLCIICKGVPTIHRHSYPNSLWWKRAMRDLQPQTLLLTTSVPGELQHHHP